MARIRVPMHYLYDPFDSKVTNFRIEPAHHCDGKRCGLVEDPEPSTEGSEDAVIDEQPPAPPHFHLIVWGEEPRTAFRCMPFTGENMPDELLALLPDSD